MVEESSARARYKCQRRGWNKRAKEKKMACPECANGDSAYHMERENDVDKPWTIQELKGWKYLTQHGFIPPFFLPFFLFSLQSLYWCNVFVYICSYTCIYTYIRIHIDIYSKVLYSLYGFSCTCWYEAENLVELAPTSTVNLPWKVLAIQRRHAVERWEVVGKKKLFSIVHCLAWYHSTRLTTRANYNLFYLQSREFYFLKFNSLIKYITLFHLIIYCYLTNIYTYMDIYMYIHIYMKKKEKMYYEIF